MSNWVSFCCVCLYEGVDWKYCSICTLKFCLPCCNKLSIMKVSIPLAGISREFRTCSEKCVYNYVRGRDYPMEIYSYSQKNIVNEIYQDVVVNINDNIKCKNISNIIKDYCY